MTEAHFVINPPKEIKKNFTFSFVVSLYADPSITPQEVTYLQASAVLLKNGIPQSKQVESHVQLEGKTYGVIIPPPESIDPLDKSDAHFFFSQLAIPTPGDYSIRVNIFVGTDWLCTAESDHIAIGSELTTVATLSDEERALATYLRIPILPSMELAVEEITRGIQGL